MQGKTLIMKLGTVIILLSSSVLWAANTSQTKLNFQLKSLVRNGSVLVAREQRVLYRFPSKIKPLLIPASVLKYATALAAFYHLGSEFRFSTKFYLGQKKSLVIKGSGDPFLVSEEWQRIAEQINLLPDMPKKLKNVFFDISLFSNNIKIPGIEHTNNPFDAQNGALLVNFNTVYLKVDSKGFVTSAEDQTPLTSLAVRLGKGLTPGLHRISIPPDLSLIYAGELVQSFFRRKGFSFGSKKVGLRNVISADRLVYTHRNISTLKEVTDGMLRFSNNFTANQLFLTIGVQRYGPPATLEKGTLALEEYLHKGLAISKEQFFVVEGSGISRKNRLTPEAIWQLLRAFVPYKNLLHGVNGVLFKTGTLSGVYTMAGYLPSRDPLYFVIMLNQPKNKRDKILKILLATDFSSGEF